MQDGRRSDFRTPHPTASRTEDDRLDRLRLVRSRRVGAVTFHRLLAEHGSAEAALAALPGIATAAGSRSMQLCPIGVVLAEMAQGRAAGARGCWCMASPDYPQALMDLPDAPPILWALGDVALLKRPMVAMVGARNASSLGLRMARRLADGSGRGGFTRRLRPCARHRRRGASGGAGATGRPSRCMAGGVDVIYPAENAALAARDRGQGLPDQRTPAGPGTAGAAFPVAQPDRRGPVPRGGRGRGGGEVRQPDHRAGRRWIRGARCMAVPGHPFDARAAGCNMLIRDGAVLVRGAAMCWRRSARRTAARPEPGDAPVAALPGPARSPAPAERCGAPAQHDPVAPWPQPLGRGSADPRSGVPPPSSPRSF